MDKETGYEMDEGKMNDLMSKGEALLQAVRTTPVGSKIILHNPDMSIWCILHVEAKEHDEQEDGGSYIRPKGVV